MHSFTLFISLLTTMTIPFSSFASDFPEKIVFTNHNFEQCKHSDGSLIKDCYHWEGEFEPASLKTIPKIIHFYNTNQHGKLRLGRSRSSQQLYIKTSYHLKAIAITYTLSGATNQWLKANQTSVSPWCKTPYIKHIIECIHDWRNVTNLRITFDFSVSKLMLDDDESSGIILIQEKLRTARY